MLTLDARLEYSMLQEAICKHGNTGAQSSDLDHVSQASSVSHGHLLFDSICSVSCITQNNTLCYFFCARRDARHWADEDILHISLYRWGSSIIQTGGCW